MVISVKHRSGIWPSKFMERRHDNKIFFSFLNLTAVSTVARSATAGEDYTAALSGTADFDANDDTEAMVTLTIMNDMNVESTEQLELTLTVAAAVGVAGEVDKAVVNILDDDAPRTFKLKFIMNY